VVKEPIAVFRGQKQWDSRMEITAPTMRRAFGVMDPELWTDTLLHMIVSLIQCTDSGDGDARNQLETQLLYSQQSAYQNPFVSCSLSRSVAIGFAIHGDTPGYLLTVECDSDCTGVDFEDLRGKHQMYGRPLDYLKEYGVPKRIGPPFRVTSVDLVDPSGQGTVGVFP
jgi:hypothetical protein